MLCSNDSLAVEYPREIRGSLRLTLQIKDLFIIAFNLIEDYRSALLLCQRGFSRDLAVYNLNVGMKGINQLRSEIEDVENRVKAKVNRNRALRHYLKTECRPGEGQNRHANRALGVVSTLHIPSNKAERKSGKITECTHELKMTAPLGVEAALHGGFEALICDVDIDQMHVPPEVDLSGCVTKSGQQLLPVVDFYRGFYFLQMHYQITLCLTANHAMPLITENMSVGQRVKGWPSNLGKPAKKGRPITIGNRLKDIQIEVTNLIARLRECMLLVQQKLTQDHIIESYYRQYTLSQERVKRSLLRCIQNQRKYCESLDAQNDRLAGLASKVDKEFPHISKFYDFTNSEGIYELVDTSVTDDSKVYTGESSSNTQQSLLNFDTGGEGSLYNKYMNTPSAGSISAEHFEEERKNSTKIQNSDSVNQLLLGADPVAPGSNPMREVVSIEPSNGVTQNESVDENFKSADLGRKATPTGPQSETEEEATPVAISSKSEAKATPTHATESNEQVTPGAKPSKSEEKATPTLTSESKEKSTPGATPSKSEEKAAPTLTAESKEKSPPGATLSKSEEKATPTITIESKEKSSSGTTPSKSDEKATPILATESKEKSPPGTTMSKSEEKATPTLTSESEEKAHSMIPTEQELKASSQPESTDVVPTESTAQPPSTVNDDNEMTVSPPQISTPPPDESNSNIGNKTVLVMKKSPPYIERKAGMSLKLPDLNDNHSTIANAGNQNRRPIVLRTGKMSDLKRAQLRKKFIKATMEDSFSSESLSEDSWMAEDAFAEVPQVSGVKCIPGWLKRESPELLTEEQLCSDAAGAHHKISNSDLEKRQVLVDAILQADGQRLEEILTTLLQHH